MTTEKLIELVGIWFTGIATFSATLVALFLPKLYRPRLSVSCDKDGIGSSSYVFIDRSGSPPMEELWVKVGVKNKSGLNAEDVQLRLIMAHNRGMAGRQGYKSFSSWWLKVSAPFRAVLQPRSEPLRRLESADRLSEEAQKAVSAFFHEGTSRNTARTYKIALQY